jgi:raffinose/stachyose/melibiose transport system substrate-binding protein
MKMKKIVALLLCVTMAGGLLSGCGKKQVTNGKTAKEEITWMFWDNLTSTQDLMSKEYAETIKRFNNNNKKYHCTVKTTNLEEYTNKVNALIASNNMPDVIICNPGPNMSQYVDANVVMDLTDTLKSDKQWYDSFTKNIFDRLTYDGKIYGVPTNYASACVFYNTEIFKKVGVEVPKTWTEFLSVCEKIKKAGYAPISVSASTPWCLAMIAGYLCDREGGPGNLEGIANKTVKWTDKSYVNASNKLIELSKYFQSTYAGDTNDQATANFYNGQAAMLVQGSWAIAQINGNAPAMQDKCGVFQFPGIEGGSDPNRWITKTDNLLVSKNTKHKDACIALLKEFTSDIAQKRTAEIAGKMPITNVSIDYTKAPKELKYVQDCMKTVTGTFGFYNESMASVEAGDLYNNTMVSIVMKTTTPEKGLQKLQDYYEKNVYNK